MHTHPSPQAHLVQQQLHGAQLGVGLPPAEVQLIPQLRQQLLLLLQVVGVCGGVSLSGIILGTSTGLVHHHV